MKVLQQRIPDDVEDLPFQGDTEIIDKESLFEEASDDYFEETHPNEWDYNLAAYTGTHDSPTTQEWFDEVNESKYKIYKEYTKSLKNSYKNIPNDISETEKITFFEQENIRQSIKNLYEYDFIDKLINQNKLNVIGLWYQINSGLIKCLDNNDNFIYLD